MSLLVVCGAILNSVAQVHDEASVSKPLMELLSQTLAHADSNREQLESALNRVPDNQRAGMEFLIAHMPAEDSRLLSAEYLLENVDFAYRARNQFAWAREVPDELFFNDVLPYASIDERRDPWRREFFEKFSPLVKDCRTCGEVAQVLNRDMFKMIDVSYHATKRPRPNQGPIESIEAGYASCSGLSVLLIDACRAMGVPARFVGIPRWATKRGNHSWVEIWDSEWKFTGACEFNQKGLNEAWFIGDASHAIPGHPMHGIYASSWKSSDKSFPLIWDLRNSSVDAVDVTSRYAGAVPVSNEPICYLSLRETPRGERLATTITILQNDRQVAEGKTSGSSRDLNDVLTLPLPAGETFVAKIHLEGGKFVFQEFTVPSRGLPWVNLFLEGSSAD